MKYIQSRLIVTLIVGLFLLTACGNQDSPTTGKKGAFIGGTQGVAAVFEPFGVEENGVFSIFDTEAFPIEVTLKNKGEPGFYYDDNSNTYIKVGVLENGVPFIEQDNITFEEVSRLAQSKSVGRPHLAAVLKEKGWVNTIQAAFNKYLADGAPAHVPKFRQTPAQAIDLVHRAGGVAVLAHPMLTNVDELIPGFVEAGLDGLEAQYPNKSETVIQFYEELAKKYGLIVTGGSDAHGDAKKHTFVGKKTISYDLVEKLKARAL